MVSSSKLFPPTLAGIRRNIYPWYCVKAFNYLGKINSDNKITQRAMNWASDMPASTDTPSLLRKPAGLDGAAVVVVVVDNKMVVKFPAIFENKN